MRRSSRVKPGAWTIDEQIELRDLFRKIKEEQEENIGRAQKKNSFWTMKNFLSFLGLEKGDLVDRILLDLSNKDKTRRQIIKELKLQGLIKNVKELKL